MSKIRINVLARELEVKSHTILEVLPELGVAEKLTHSSSIDDDVAEKLRHRFAGEGGEERSEVEAGADLEGEQPPRPRRNKPVEPSMNGTSEEEEGEMPAAETETEQEQTEPARAAQPAVVPVPRMLQPRKPALPIRPPLASPGSSPQTRGVEPGRPPATRPVIPARPLPVSPKPGQVLTPASGPRQPFPAGVGETVRPPLIQRQGPSKPQAPPSPPPGSVLTPGAPIAPPPRPAPSQPHHGPQAHQTHQTSAPAMPPPAPPSSVTAPGPPQPRPNRPLAGQPVQRPVVPPRPDMVAKLQQGRPGQPSPRPGAPSRAQTSPVPGQPIYKGPIRPGQPMLPKGTRAATTRPAGPRPMHPTSRGRIEPGAPMPAPGDAPRRVPDRRDRVQRGRGTEPEERMLRHPSSRREAPAGPPPITRDITISEGITVKELAEKLDVKSSLVIKKLVDRNIFATINQTLDAKLATEIARGFGASTSTVSYEQEAMQEVADAEVERDLLKRAPVVTIMGHVDHGKTSLLDAIRLANVADKEAGGITQHIGAYRIEKNGRKIVFIDTPGHEAFTRMRARGAKVTDVVVLVVAADDGVMPQTLEAIDHAKAAGVPIIVAINKIDKADAHPERVKQQLSDRGLLAEDWGGETVMVPVSAKAKQNLDLLLEMILLVADLQDLKANPNRPAMGSVLEAQLDRGRGPVATVLVRNGTLRVGDYFICGLVFGKVRAMLDDLGQQVREAEPSTPVEVLGLESLPEAGDSFQVVTDTAKAKQIVLFREAKAREQALARSNRITLDQLHKQMESGEVKELPLILKTDVGGSAEVLTDTLQKLSNDRVRIRVIHSGVGAITESDVLLASASNAIIVGFSVRPERNAAQLAEQEKVEIRLHTIIYNLTDEIKKAMTGLLEPEYREIYKGKAEVRETFRVTKVGMVAGCMVLDGTIGRSSEMRLLRDNIVIHTGRIGSLRRFKDDVSEVRGGMECGITIDNFGDIKQGDIIEAFVKERVNTDLFN